MKSAPGRSQAGFTLVELIITLAMAAILIGIALPAFNDFMRQREMISRINDMVVAITYARSEAVRQGRVVSVVAADPDDDNEWGGGYCVAVGVPDDCDDDDVVLRRIDGFDNATLDAVGGLNLFNVLSFNARGLLMGGAGGGLRLCSNDPAVDPGRMLNLNPTGRVDVDDLECNP